MLAATQGTGGFNFGAAPAAALGQRSSRPQVFKSTDEGKTWTQIKIPPYQGRIAVAVAMHTTGPAHVHRRQQY